VITSLTDKKAQHIPYRESKLTRILQESLGGNSKTALIITCSPHPFNEQETLSTLRFGTRARNIKNQPKVNREYTIPELKRLLEKAEAEVDIQKCKVKALENIIKSLGGVVPRDDVIQQMAEEELKKEEDQEAEEMITEDLSNLDVSLPPSSEAGSLPSEIHSEESKDEQQEPAVLIDQELLQEKTEQIEDL
jgi:kinesin family protein 5